MLAGMARLGDLMTREVLTVAPEDTLGEAAQKMVERGVGSAVVMDFGRLIGILTERDLLRAVAARTHSSEARVREWMTAEPITADEDTNPAGDLRRSRRRHREHPRRGRMEHAAHRRGLTSARA